MTSPNELKRPRELEFALEFCGDPEETIARQYIEALEARAALAQPEQEGPTDEELDSLAWNWYSKTGSTWWQRDNWRAFARAVLAHAVLARWSRPAIQPVPAPMSVDTLAAIIREVDGGHDKGAAALAEAILAHPAARNAHPPITP
jgi:hypothetical protein